MEAEKNLKLTDLLQSLGDSGTQRYSGYFQEEPNLEWRDDARVRNVETMRRTDGTVGQLLVALKAPILSTDFMVLPASQDAKDKEIAEFVRENLFEGMQRTWKEFLRESLTFFDFGFEVFEKIWGKRDGKIVLLDLAPRIQHSILKWQLTDGRKGVVQLLQTDEVENHQAEIPMKKLLVLTNDKEGDDITGRSVLRPAWKHFYIKDTLYKISGISCERFGVGVPVITLPAGSGDAERDKAEELGKNFRSNEQAYVILPSADWKIEILTPGSNPQSSQIEQLIQHHDRMILCAGLAGFLNLGAGGGGGSYALSDNQSSFFVSFVEDKLKYFAEQMQKQVIKELVDYNYSGIKKYPQLSYAPIDKVALENYATSLASLVTSNLVDVTPQLKAFIHKTFKLPEITEERMQEMEIEDIEKQINSEIDEKQIY